MRKKIAKFLIKIEKFLGRIVEKLYPQAQRENDLLVEIFPHLKK